MTTKTTALIERPEELIYRSYYAPVRLEELLARAETRSKIRRIPPPQLFFSLKELDDEDIARLLPHVTEEQWTGILDLDVWKKDRLTLDLFLSWERHLAAAEDPVARKIIRATDPELWELAFARDLKVLERLEEDEWEVAEERGESFETPDGNFLILLPQNSEKARVYRHLILKLYELDPSTAALLLAESRVRTSTELEEEAYQNRRRRIEDLGFQDYFDAIEIYTPLDEGESLPRKRWEKRPGLELHPAPMEPFSEEEGPLLFLAAISRIDQPELMEALVEELFYVCNKLLSADRVSPAEPTIVKKGIRKALTGINLGLGQWAQGDLIRAVEGIQKHYLVSFFQLGYGALTRLRSESEKLVDLELPPGSYLEQVREGFLKRYPLLSEQKSERIQRRLIRHQEDLEWAWRLVGQIKGQSSA